LAVQLNWFRSPETLRDFDAVTGLPTGVRVQDGRSVGLFEEVKGGTVLVYLRDGNMVLQYGSVVVPFFERFSFESRLTWPVRSLRIRDDSGHVILRIRKAQPSSLLWTFNRDYERGRSPADQDFLGHVAMWSRSRAWLADRLASYPSDING
jgi:hypothetical protein